MKTISVKNKDSGVYYRTEDGEFLCAHADAYIEKACCAPGTTDCGCFGRDSVICPNKFCAGIQDHEVDAVFEAAS